MIGPDDRGFTLGDGLFETVLAEAGALRHLGQHLARLAAGCAIL
ncbi:MAG: 2-keto-4-methylthiobutyrate aminotransferase, partial [Phenylobacterium sp.]|nr:2-keto-4-methylthiobutyrate aminotransferase [Phenylobacterium sp.]